MIDIIIPVYRAHKTLDRCLASIVMQTVRTDLMVSLVNDHPTEEDYSEFVNRYSPVLKIRELKLQNPSGLGAVRQFGIDSAKSEFFAFVDADDTLSDSMAMETMYHSMGGSVVVCSGAFQEFKPDGSSEVHHRDMIWVFGKLYRKSFWDKYRVTFMASSSANEDTGVNAIIDMLSSESEKIEFIDTIVYQWHYNDSSITRQNDCRYTYDQNIIGYSENMTRAVHFVRSLNPANPKVVHRIAFDICNLYKMHLETWAKAPQYIQSSWSAARAYYDSCFPQATGMPIGLLTEEYDKVMYGDEFPLRGVIPHITLMDFMQSLAVSGE